MNEQIGNKINDKTYIKLTPFKGFVLENFPFIEADFDAITNYQLLCKVIEYLNNVIANQNTVQELGTDLVNAYNALVDAVNLAINEFETDVTADINQFKVDINNDFDEFTSNITTQFNNLKNYVDNYFDNNFPQMISDKLDEMAQDGTLENLLNDSAHLTKSYNTYVEMMADSSTFTNGLRLKTLGYYTINDGGGAEYYVNNSVISTNYQINLENGLYLNLITNDETINIKQFGAYGDDTHDDTTIIQSVFNYAYDNGIKNIFIPKGTYKIITPLFIWEGCKIIGENYLTCNIHKTTTTKSDNENYDVDSVLIISKRNYTYDTECKHTSINNITIYGCIESFDNTKLEDDFQYAIFGRGSTPQTTIDSVRTYNVDVAIKTTKLYMSRIINCPWLSGYQRGIYVSSESQGLVISHVNTGNTHLYGIDLAGATYSTLESVLVEYVYGGTAFRFNSWGGIIINCGYEVGDGVERGIHLQNSNIEWTGGYFTGSTPTDSGNYMLYLTGSNLTIDNSLFGYNVSEYKGSLAYISNSSLILKNDNTFHCSFANDIIGNGNYASVTIKNRTFDVLQKRNSISSIHASADETYLDKEINNIPKYNNRTLYLDNINTPLTNSQGSIEWDYPYNKGDFGLINNSLVNGKALWICNRNNKYDNPQSTGTISSLESGYIFMTSLALENYSNTGIRLYSGATIEGVTSGAVASINSVNASLNRISVSISSGTFVVGEKIKLKATGNARGGDYLYVPIINGGFTQERPTTSLVVGEMFFDKTLNKPIWYTGSGWVDSTGTSV